MVHSLVNSWPVSSTKMDQFKRETESYLRCKQYTIKLKLDGQYIKQRFLI